MDFAKKFRTLTVLPFMAAVMIASAFSPLTNVVVVNAREMGTEYAQPWRQKTLTGLARECRTQLLRFKDTCASILDHPFATPAMAGLAVLTAAFVDPHAGAFAGVMLMGKVDVKALRQVEIDCNTEIDEITATITKEKRAMNSDERAKFEAAKQRKKDNADVLADAEARQARDLATEALADGDTAAAAAAAKAGGIIQVRDRAEDDPKRGFKSHREFMSCVMAAARGKVDQRLKPLAAAGSDEQGEYSDPYGNFLIPSAFSPEVLSIQSEGDPTAALTRPMPMDAPSVLVNARVDKNHSASVSGGLVVYRHGETDTTSLSRMKFEQLRFNAEDLIGAGVATENQVTDSPSSFIALISDGFKDEFGRKTLREKVRGTGAGGQYLGALNSPALITVAKETGQAADTIVKENIDKMEARLWAPDTSDRVAYLANKTTYPKLVSLVQVVGTGGNAVPYLTRDAGGWRLNGRRLYFTEVCSAVGDVGDIILVNWAEYIEALYQPLQQAESIHVRFLNNERVFKFWLRNCGMPWWATPLTPEFGETLSPLVTLASR